MGGRPPQGEEHRGRDERANAAREDSLGHLLGEQWRSEGDGIYRFVAPGESREPPPAEPPPPPDDLDDLIAELSSDLVRERREESALPPSAHRDRSPDRH